jgi:hypothetical protein
MYTTVNEDGVLNNYPNETKAVLAEYPAVWEQRRYFVQGLFAASFVTAIILVAFAAS